MKENSKNFSIAQRIRMELAKNPKKPRSAIRLAIELDITIIQAESNLKSLRRGGYLERNEEGKYTLTKKGLELARIKTEEGIKLQKLITKVEKKISTLCRNFGEKLKILQEEKEYLLEKLGTIEVNNLRTPREEVENRKLWREQFILEPITQTWDGEYKNV